MSRYLLLVVLNLPFILAGMVSNLVYFKMRRLSFRVFLVREFFWIVILVGLSSAGTIYGILFSAKLTETQPLSLFDVIELTGIVGCLFLISRYREKLNILEKSFRELHQALSLKLSDEDE